MTTADMTPTIQAKSNQMNADDLIGGPVTIKITRVSVIGNEQPVSINYEGDNGKPFKPCKSMCRVLVEAWGKDGNAYVGQSMTLWRDPSVTWAGKEVGGIRISHMSGIDKDLSMSLTATRGSKKLYTVKPLVQNVNSPKPAANKELEKKAYQIRDLIKQAPEAADVDYIIESNNADLLKIKEASQPAYNMIMGAAQTRKNQVAGENADTPKESPPSEPGDVFPGDIPDGMTAEEHYEQQYGGQAS